MEQIRKQIKLVIIGGGPAGMAAAVAAYDRGERDILVLERDDSLGGILRQCIHNGFGLHRFGEELTGPEYADRYKKEVEKREIRYLTNTTVLTLEKDESADGLFDKRVTAINEQYGVFTLSAAAVVLAMGCRERPRGALNLPGDRVAGVYTAGTAQRFVNIKGLMPGREVVILGSGDIGLIMARRMTLEGAKVRAVCELMPYSGGLTRNIVQCLEDFGIPLKLSHTVSKIHGENGRVKGVTISRVDEKLQVIPEESEYIPCDTLLLSCGLIPENELTKGAGIELDSVTGGALVDEKRETEMKGVFACGNVLHVHDLVDYVSEEASLAGEAAADCVAGKHSAPVRSVKVCTTGAVRYTVPQKIGVTGEGVRLYFRVGRVLNNAYLVVKSGDTELYRKKKRKMTPGEMESLVLGADIVSRMGEEITVMTEEADK